MFVQGVVPELLTNREAHQCLEYEGVFLVVGGYGPAYIYYLHSIYYLLSRYDHVYSQGPHGPGHDTYSDHSSAEYYDGAEWHAAGSLTQPRSRDTWHTLL